MAPSSAFAELSALLHQAVPGGLDDGFAAAITSWLDRHPPTSEQRVELIKARHTLRRVLHDGEFSPAAFKAMCELVGSVPTGVTTPASSRIARPQGNGAVRTDSNRIVRQGIGEASRPAGARVVPPQSRHGDSTTIRRLPDPPPVAVPRRGDSTTLRPVAPSRTPAPDIRELERRTTASAPPQPPSAPPRSTALVAPRGRERAFGDAGIDSDDGVEPTTARHLSAEALVPKVATVPRSRAAASRTSARAASTPLAALIARPLGWLTLLIGLAITAVQTLPAGTVPLAALGSLERVLGLWPGPLWLVLALALLSFAALGRIEGRD